MKNIFLVILGFVAVFIFIVVDTPTGHVYDCGMAEWHPDIPRAVKEECRRMHKEEWDRIQQESKKKLIST